MEDLEHSPDLSVQSTPPPAHAPQISAYQLGFSGSSTTFRPKLSIKLQDNNFLLCTQQVEGVIISHKLHKIVVNPQIPSMFKTKLDQILNLIYEEYEAWIVQDHDLFTWILSTIFESFLPRVLACKHAYQVWDKVHKHYNSHMKARVYCWNKIG